MVAKVGPLAAVPWHQLGNLVVVVVDGHMVAVVAAAVGNLVVVVVAEAGSPAVVAVVAGGNCNM